MAKERILEAKAYRTMIGLKEQGYSLNSAIGDIIDNSLSPSVGTTDIKVIFDKSNKGEFFVRILDNGKGMNNSELFEAMRYGAGEENNYEINDLGKFGMGMKTASTSQARILTVLSKSKLTGKISAFKWDLDYVQKSKKWTVLELEQAEIKKIINSESLNFKEHYNLNLASTIEKLNSWTLVCWDNMEIINRDFLKCATVQSAKKFHESASKGLDLYLRRTFGRFIVGEQTKMVKISFNGNRLEQWDPFCRSEKHTLEDAWPISDSSFIITNGKKKYKPILIRRYILPAKEGRYGFSNTIAWNDSFGNEGANDSQGYYIYRNNRLVDFGGWKRLRKKDEHLKLARVCIDLTDNHDHLFELDVKKTRVVFPAELMEHLQEKINKGYHTRAINRYNSSNKKVEITNSFRNKTQILKNVSKDLVKKGSVKISEDARGKKITVVNKYGKITTDSIYKQLNQNLQIQSRSFGNKRDLWVIQPDPSKGFILVLNEDHLFYSKIYKEASTIKSLSALADAFLYTFSFVELRCKSSENESLFDDIRLVVAEVLDKFINEKLI